MPKTIEFFFDFLSPPSYLAYTQLPGIAERTGAEIIWRPMFTIGLHLLTGNTSPIMVPNKGVWARQDVQRFAKRYGVPLNINPHVPLNILPALRGALVAQEEGSFEAYCRAIYTAMWVDGADLSDPAVFAGVIESAGLDAAHFAEAIRSDAIKEKLKADTQEAADRGAFGAPTFFIGDEMHFGQDRLDFVEAAVALE